MSLPIRRAREVIKAEVVGKPLISCIVPVYNGERFLREALDSILAQTYRPLEIIAVDDGSTDGTAKVVEGYGSQIHYVWQPNTGPPAARDLGVSKAEGEFVAFLDADDLWHPEKLVRQMARFQARPELGLCFTHAQHFWVPELHQEEVRLRDHRLTQPLPAYGAPTLLARRELFDAIGQFNTGMKFGDAMDWVLRAAELGVVIEMLPDALVSRRMHQANSSLEPGTWCMTPAMQDSLLKVLKASLERRRGRGGPTLPAYNFPASDWRQRGKPEAPVEKETFPPGAKN